MQLTREADYAIRTVLEVASQPVGTATSTAEISERRHVPRAFLRKIVPRLVRAGLLASRRGKRGGLMLARPVELISLLAVIDVAQGPPAVNRCVLRPEICVLQPTCPVHEVCVRAREQLVELFGGVSFAALAERGAELRAQRMDPVRAQ